ncbi:MAG: hypothetical protein ACXABY_30630 [Candidatus Thorarchaeota archaeon]
MEELILKLDGAGELDDGDGNPKEISAQEVAEVIGTTPQVVGKVMKCFYDVWKPSKKNGRVVYIPIEEGSD